MKIYWRGTWFIGMSIIQSVSTDWLVPLFFSDVTASWSRADVTLHFFLQMYTKLTLALWTLIIIYYIQETYICKITSNHLLQLEIGENCSTRPFYHVGVTSACYVYQKNSFLDDFAHKLLMILDMNFDCRQLECHWNFGGLPTPLLAH